MALDAASLGSRLRKARENCRLTQDQAAQAIGTSRTALVHIESGRRSLSTLELSQLAKLYMRPVTDFFTDEPVESREDDPLVVLHRLPTNFSEDAEVKNEVARRLELCAIAADLKKTLGVDTSSPLPLYDLPAPTRLFDAIEQGERVAEEERRRLGLGIGAIADLSDILGAQGIWVSEVEDLPDAMAGLFLSHSSIGMAVIVNGGHPLGRKRFSYAHEYAHALLDRKGTTAIVTRQENAQELIEKRANAFASAFLMPADGVRWFVGEVLSKGAPSRQHRVSFSEVSEDATEAEDRAVPGSQLITFQDALSLAHFFGVSYPAAVYRLSDLGMINGAEKDELITQRSLVTRWLKAQEKDETVDTVEASQSLRSLRAQLVYLAIEAYRREEASQGWLRDLADKIDVDGELLLQLAEEAAVN